MKGMPRASRRRGVSEVIGALLLIVVVVAAVASISVFLGEAQKNAQSRQSYITEVQDEDLQIPFSQFYPNNPLVQWELDAVPGPAHNPSYYVQMVNSSFVTLAQIGMPTNRFVAKLINGQFNYISSGVAASLTSGSPGSVNFAGTGWTFNTATWTNATITVRNLNTASSEIYQIRVNGDWLTNWYQVDQTDQNLVGTNPYGVGLSPLTVPAKGSVNLNLTLAAQGIDIAKNAPLEITILTQLGNYFSVQYSPPVPVPTSSTATENYLVTNRDIVTFDGSQSQSATSSIESYFWVIDVPNSAPACSTSSFSSPADFDTAYVTGEVVQFTPESLFPNGLTADCITGPVRATLTVVDDNGFIATSQSIIVPQDQNIAPPSALSLVPPSPTCTSGTAYVKVTNIFGQPVGGTGVVAFASGDVLLTDSSAVTDPTSGIATFSFTCTTGGTIEFTSGGLPPVFEAVS